MLRRSRSRRVAFANPPWTVLPRFDNAAPLAVRAAPAHDENQAPCVKARADIHRRNAMTLRKTRRAMLLAGTAAGAAIAMPWIAKGAAEFQLKYANNSPTAHTPNLP